jgi:general nucleoside transport system permease protein
VAGVWYTGSLWGGIAVAAIAAMVTSLVLVVGTVVFDGDAIVLCIGINLLAAGLTAYLLRELFGLQGVFQDPKILSLPKLRVPLLADVPWAGPVLSGQTPLTYASWAFVAVAWFVLFRTTWGLRLRGVGESPDAAETLGVNVGRYRCVAVLLGGALCGLAGAQLSLGSGLFTEGMSAGRGWIAVVAVMLGQAHPIGVFGASALFALSDAVGLRLQGQGLPNQLTDAAPYVVTLIALVLARARRRTRSLA